jgi:hypothetical protein
MVKLFLGLFLMSVLPLKSVFWSLRHPRAPLRLQKKKNAQSDTQMVDISISWATKLPARSWLHNLRITSGIDDRVPDRDNILRIHSVHSRTMRHHYDLNKQLMSERVRGAEFSGRCLRLLFRLQTSVAIEFNTTGRGSVDCWA